MNMKRRRLNFSSLDQVIPEVERLLRGHTTIGNWSLGQICNHLAQGIDNSIDGFPAAARPPWILQKTLGRFVLRRTLRTGVFMEGMRAPVECQPRAGVDATAELEALRKAVQRFLEYSGPLAEHPLSGPVKREVWERFHCIHCSHHLGFVVPEEQQISRVQG